MFVFSGGASANPYVLKGLSTFFWGAKKLTESFNPAKKIFQAQGYSLKKQ